MTRNGVQRQLQGSHQASNSPHQTRRALLLINPYARYGEQARAEATEYLEALGFRVIQERSAHPRNFSYLIDCHRKQVDLIIIGGGDGTLNAAAEGLVKAKRPLGILPLGAANDLARNLGIPLDLKQACDAIATGLPRPIDLGWVNGKYFFNVVSLGLSVQTTRQLAKDTKRTWGIFAYLATALRALRQAKPFQAEILVDGASTQVNTVQIAIGNGRYYSGGMKVPADATIGSQRLGLYSLEVQHRWQLLALLPSLWQGRFYKWLGVRTLETREIKIFTRRSYPIKTDGELQTYTPAHIKLVPQALSVLVPPPFLLD
ncbi:MAG: lipid kinase [Synechococcales bacterium]|nr:lipid kinase [Synechococcales bacterium]